MEDSPPNIPPRTLRPPAEIDAHMVQLALSSMATTLEKLSQQINNQHSILLDKFEEVKSLTALAGNMAQRALGEIETVRESLAQIAQAMDGLEQASRSLIDTVYPERRSSMPSPELADVVHIRRVMTGE